MGFGTLIFIYILSYVIAACICGAICQHINESKGYYGGFAWGFLGVIGIIVVACRSDSPAKMASYIRQSEALSRLSSIAENPTATASRRRMGNDWICAKCGRIVPGYSSGCTCGMRRDESSRIMEAQKLEKEAAEKSANEQREELNNIEILIKYKELFDKGVITQEEFDKKKESILAGNPQGKGDLANLPAEPVEWFCVKCGKSNPNERGTCYYCGAFKQM
ncbi:MAG: SHOCT domain-containing protein [Lachnospiraceae bacterium]|nr:SHOCT domain-containing protein [Lachnospiraceae bacterium]